ncbi:MAG: S46 family peptidase [Candidatus Cryptobacteroides sp.]
MICAACPRAKADEGMWLPSLIGSRIGDMQSKGFRLDAEDIYSINEASLKDAVVLFGGGCTGELISPEGLLLTNHHCGYRYIQFHSSVEHDYLRDGFWAMNRSEELPNKNLTVRFLERMEDVTSAVLKGASETSSAQEIAEIVKRNSEMIVSEATKEGAGLKASVEALYYGNQYFMFVFREYSDIRLVGAPPSSIGKFGGDTDNWMWPRHTGDFSIFRIYADKDNNPAGYSEDNVPYRPKKYFNISTAGVHEGDFTFIYGFPGSTSEYLHSEAVRYIAQTGDPQKIRLRTLRLDIQKKYMDSSQKIRIQYSSKHASVANSWKKWQGEMLGLRKMNTVENKREYEKRFSAWAEGTGYEGVCDRLDSLYRAMEPYSFARDLYMETARTVELARYASGIESCFRQEDGSTVFDKARAGNLSESFFKDYCLDIDKECFVAVMEEFGRNMPEDSQPSYFKEMMERFGSVSCWAEHIFGSSSFISEDFVSSLCEDDMERVKSDPAVVFCNEFQKWYNSEIMPEASKLGKAIAAECKTYMKGQMACSEECADGRVFYPDANLTLRVAYGHVKGYSPADGIYYKPSSTITGIIEKDDPDIFDYNIPQSLRDIYASKDYGRWADENGEIPVCFLADNHTTGGNSGSPVINADGNLIGINFDRVWEGTMSDIVFDPDRCRNISLDIRYVLFIIDRIGKAGWLFDEMTFVGQP